MKDFVAWKNDKRFGKSIYRKPLAQILADKPNSKIIETPQNIKIVFDRGTKTKLEKLLGRKLNNNQIGGMVGALENATVKVQFGENDGLTFNVEHPLVKSQIRTLSRDQDNLLRLHNDYFRTSERATRGTGLKSFATQVFHAEKFGIDYIDTFAAGNYQDLLKGKWNGYYTWARFGYNGILTNEDKAKLSGSFRDAKDLNELMKLGGSSAWKEIGSGRSMIFILDKTGKSWEILTNYLLINGFEINL